MRKGFRAFWDRFGYVVVVCVCVGMVTATAVWTRWPKPAAVAPEVTRYALPTATPRPVAAEVSLSPTATPSPFYLPCDGKPGMTYALETLVYNETLQEYAVHRGVDFLGAEGDAVRAAADGTVTAVYEDALLGHCVEVTHRDGYSSLYASLATEGLVAVKDPVSRGQVLGTMGTSALCEYAEGAHLHFELRRLKSILDPMIFLREID